MVKLIVTVVVALCSALAADVVAQEGPLHPPPFLEPTTLFWTFRPDLSPGRLDLDAATALDADIFPHFVLVGSRRCAASRAHGAIPCVSVTPGIRIRMENAESAPIESPSFMPRLNMQWLLYRDSRTVNVGLYIGHHSNGQAGPLFAWADGTYAQDGSLTLDDLKSGAARPDIVNGNFSVNYARIAVDFARYVPPVEDARYIAGYRFSGSVERAPDNWKFESLRNEIYPTWQYRLMGGFAIANAPLCERADIFVEAHGYEYNSEMAGSFATQLTCLSSQDRGLGFFIRYSNGRDDYNSSFFLDGSQRLQLGLTINRLRTFGIDY